MLINCNKSASHIDKWNSDGILYAIIVNLVCAHIPKRSNRLNDLITFISVCGKKKPPTILLFYYGV